MLKRPESMEECVYFTNRNLGEKGMAMAWVFRNECPKCKKGLMGKPKDPKTGKIKVRAKEYLCSECDYVVDKKEYEETLTCNIAYTCPGCEHEGEAEVPFIRKTIKGVPTVRATCEECGGFIDVTKKMKEPKKKK